MTLFWGHFFSRISFSPDMNFWPQMPIPTSVFPQNKPSYFANFLLFARWFRIRSK